ncbi:MAG: HD domain-containing protein [Candidatus Melainabacteria bacterium]|nr:HD domain-containing protein [Candidatus Melainabacteria bacterium]
MALRVPPVSLFPVNRQATGKADLEKSSYPLEKDPSVLIHEINTKRKSELVSCAIEFASKKHFGVNRKGGEVRGFDIQFITHPLRVGLTLVNLGLSDEIVAAGILHDTVEDTNTTYDEIRECFGATVADYVRWASEKDKSDTWENRKKQTIEEVSIVPLEPLYIEIADKLDNLRTIYEDLQIIGESTWDIFKRGKPPQEWYYKSLHGEFMQRVYGENNKELIALTKEYSLEFARVFED